MTTASVNVFAATSPPVPTLTSARVFGFTPDGGNDKDANSQLKIKLFVDFGGGFVQTVGETEFAAFGRFPDGQPWGPINIPIKGTFPISNVGSLKGKLEFRPNGDDTWKFTYTLALVFSDGSEISRDGSHTVSENQEVPI